MSFRRGRNESIKKKFRLGSAQALRSQRPAPPYRTLLRQRSARRSASGHQLSRDAEHQRPRFKISCILFDDNSNQCWGALLKLKLEAWPHTTCIMAGKKGIRWSSTGSRMEGRKEAPPSGPTYLWVCHMLHHFSASSFNLTAKTHEKVRVWCLSVCSARFGLRSESPIDNSAEESRFGNQDATIHGCGRSVQIINHLLLPTFSLSLMDGFQRS